MTKQESINYISSLINDPAGITDGDQSSIALFRQKYPYFIPMRYLLALESHKKGAWSPAMISAIRPYSGNWILFCAYLAAGNPAEQSVSGGEIEISVVNTSEVPEEPAASSVIEEPGEMDGPVSDEQVIIPRVTVEQPVDNDLFVEQDVDLLHPDLTGALVEDTQEATEVTSFTEETEEQTSALEPEPKAEQPAVAEEIIFAESTTEQKTQEKEEEQLITPIHSQDYFLHQGERISEDLPEQIDELKYDQDKDDEDKSLMVMMSFSEWLLHFKNSSQKQKEELKDRKALRTMWQKEKLAAAMEEENEEIPENVFEMAVNSISSEDGLVSETLADIYIKQGKYDKAVEVYRKLSLRNPQKNVYFARKIDEILKDKQS